MRHVIVDMYGRSLAYCDRREDTIEAICAEEEICPGVSSELMLITYDSQGHRIGKPEPADEVLKATQAANPHYQCPRGKKL